jgi:flagellar basal body-associated protein FliL
MSDILDENEEPASQEELDEIDAILQETAPEFVQELKSINAENLNNKEIGPPSEEEEKKKDKWYYRLWFGFSRTQQLLVVVGAFTVFVALPLLLLSVLGIFTPSFLIAEQTSLEMWADETITLDNKKPQKNLMDLFLIDQFFLEIPEQIYVIKPRGEVKIARFAFYMELISRQDEPYFSYRYEEIIEILSRTLKQYSVDDFKGIEGKEEMRKVILASLNSKLSTKIKNIRYKLVVF